MILDIDSIKKRLSRTSLVTRAAIILPLPALVYFLLAWNWPLSHSAEVFAVRSGSSMSSIARDLYTRNVVPDPFSLRMLARITGAATRIKAGEYQFKSGMSQYDILTAMTNGDQVRYSLLLVEGATFADLVSLLSKHEKIEQTLTGLKPTEVMDRLSYGGQHPEGQFFPDTYTFTAGTKDLEILRQAYSRMQAELDMAWEKREPDLPYANKQEVLIMASIIEKETGRPEDRGRVAAVFVNRLRKGMRLQTDPTVIYGMGTQFDGNLRKRDLLRDTPYNTYTRRGLPPTPIALPGHDSIFAALHPAPTNDLYFVARGDGTSHFSESLMEHNRAVRKYQLGGK